MIEEVPSPRARVPLHATSSCGARCTTGCRGRGAPSCTCASARRSRRGTSRSGRALADLAHHFAAAAPFGGTGRARRVQPARRAGGHRGARLRRGGGAAAHRARRWGSTARRSAPEVFARARPREPPRREGARRARRRSGRRRTSPASWRTRSCSRARRSATRTPAGAPGMADQGAVELLEEAAAALGDERLGAARRAARRARPRARLPGRPRARRDRPHERDRRWRGGSTTASGSPPC